jgi:hypothetical protein
VEEHADGSGAVIGQGDTYDEALADVVSAIRLPIETSGPDAIDAEALGGRLVEDTTSMTFPRDVPCQRELRAVVAPGFPSKFISLWNG